MFSNTILKWHRHNLINLFNENLDLWDKLNETLRDKNYTILLAALCSLAYNISKLIGNLLKFHRVFLDFLTDKDPVNSSLQGTLKGDVRCRSSHQSDEVVITLAGQCINTEVSDSL
jgi:hypothetical protein